MNSTVECVLIGFKNYSLNERMLLAKGNEAALNYCKHEYVKYHNQYFFYDELFTYLCKGKTDVRYSISEMPYFGIIYLHNYLISKGISVLSFNNFDYEKNEIKKVAEKQTVPVIVISSVFYTSPIPLIKVVKEIRKIFKDSKIVVGGAYLYNKYNSTQTDTFYEELKIIGADYYICEAQGEEALLNIINYENGRLERSKIKNTIFNDKGNITKSEFEKECNDINLKIDFNNTSDNLLSGTLNIRTARGCPNRCSFCNYPIRNPKLELQSDEVILKQINDIKKLEMVKNVVFIDDSFNMPLPRFKNICRMMIDNHLNKNWYSYFRMSHCDEEAIKLMKESGCAGVFLGVESANDNVLNNMNKRTSVKQYTDVLKLFEKYDIPTFAYLMIGFPGETKETIEDNIKFLNNNHVTFYSFNLWFAETNTPVYKRKEEFDLDGEGFEWSHYTMNSVEASKLMTYMYEKVENSIYVPGENFSFWGIPYMIGKGFSLDEVKKMLILMQKYRKENYCSGIENEEYIGEIQKILIKGGEDKN